MTRTNITVIVRVLLYVLAGVLMRGGWAPHGAEVFFLDPEIVELLSGGILAIATGFYTAKHEKGKGNG